MSLAIFNELIRTFVFAQVVAIPTLLLDDFDGQANKIHIIRDSRTKLNVTPAKSCKSVIRLCILLYILVLFVVARNSAVGIVRTH